MSSVSCRLPASMRWEKVDFSHRGEGGSEGPGKRWGHTCNAIKGGRFLYVFGGYGKYDCQTYQVHVFDTVNETWSEPVIKGTPPTPRDSHTCTVVGDNLFVFGGTDGNGPLRDLHILDTSLQTWLSPKIRGEAPEAREGHGAALVGKRLFIFGGCGKSPSTNNEIYFSDLHVLNTETFVWKRAATSGTPPCARDSHTCSSWKNKIIVVGGEDATGNCLSDVHVLDTDNLIWKELNTSGHLMPPRAGHSAISFGNYLFIFGGFTVDQQLYNDLYVLDIEMGIWTKVITAGNGPSLRFSVAGDSLDPQKNGVLVFLGGCSRNLDALEDMYFLHTGLIRGKEWRLEKLSLKKQLKLRCQEQNHSSGPDISPLKTGTSTGIGHLLPVSSSGQPNADRNLTMNRSEPQLGQGKQTFRAKIVENLLDGCIIETIIDGKPLRGVVFSNKPSLLPTTNQNSDRKRAAADSVLLIGDHSHKEKAPRTTMQDAVAPADGPDGKELIQPEVQKNVDMASVSKDGAPFDPSEPHKVPVKLELSATLNINDSNNDAQCSGTTESVALPKTG